MPLEPFDQLYPDQARAETARLRSAGAGGFGFRDRLFPAFSYYTEPDLDIVKRGPRPNRP